MLESVTVTAMRLVLKPEPKAPKIIGNMLIPYNTFKLPPYFGNRFSRLIIQPYVLDCETNDTITFCTPVRIRRQGICPDAGTQNGL